MPTKLINCTSLPDATITSLPIYDFAEANEELAKLETETYYPCCGKIICCGCIQSLVESGNLKQCPYCKAEISMDEENDNIDEENHVKELMKRVEANDPNLIYELANHHHTKGLRGSQEDREKAKELWTQAAKLGSSQAHFKLGVCHSEGGDLKKAKFHFEFAAMAGHEVAREMMGLMEGISGNMEGSIKHLVIAASSGNYSAMHELIKVYKSGYVSRESIDSTLTAYNNSCKEMRSEARDAYIKMLLRSKARDDNIRAMTH
jgi:TPR repeat protein